MLSIIRYPMHIERYMKGSNMSTKSVFQIQEAKKLTAPQLKALIAYCLMVNAGCSDLTVGEVHEFVVTNGKRPVTIQRTQRALEGFVSERMILKRMDLQASGKRMSHRYYPCDQTFRAAALYSSFLPTKLGEFADALLTQSNEGIAAAQKYIRDGNRLNCNGAAGPADFANTHMFQEGGH